jgi:hypothetical protein
MKSVIALLFLALAVSAYAQTNQLTTQQVTQPERPSHRGILLWRTSAVTLAVAHVLDFGSSVALNRSPGVHETNGFLRTSTGYYSVGKGAAVNSALTVGPLVVEWLILRHHPKLAKGFAVINFGTSAGPIWAGAHNLSLRQ